MGVNLKRFVNWEVGLVASAVVIVAILIALLPTGLGQRLLSTDFMPHGHCYLWRPDILWLHVGSDTMVALSYFAIPMCLIYIVRQRRGLKFRGVFWLFSLFILFCGMTHALEVYSVWTGAYYLTGGVKLLTGLISAATAIYLIKATPLILKLPLPEEYQAVERRLGERETQFETILKGGVDAFLMLRPQRSEDGRLLHFTVEECNEIASSEMELPRREAIGRPVDKLLSFAGSMNLLNELTATFERQEPKEGEVEITSNGERERWISYKIIPAGSILALFFTDVTRARLAERDLQKALEERANKALLESDIQAARAKAALSASVHGIVITDLDCKIVQTNRQLQEFFDYPEPELVGKPFEDLLPERHHATLNDLKQQILSQPPFRRMHPEVQLQGLRKDGSCFPVELGLNAFETPEGNFIIASILDITERLEARRALEESELRFQQAVSGGNVGIWHWLDVERDEVWWSPKFYELLGYENGEILATLETFYSVLHPADRPQTYEVLQSCIKGGQPFSIDYRLKTASGEYRWFYATGTVALDDETGTTRMVGSIQDIQDRKDAEDQIRRANAALEAKNVEMEQMMYAVSHDLKTPLVSIQGLVGYLRDTLPQLDEDAVDIMKRIEDSASHMGDLISDILEMSRVGRVSEDEENVDTREVAEEVLTILGHGARSADWQWRIAEDLPTLRINRTRMRQLLQNLASNALKYGAAVTGENALEMGCERSEAGVAIYVRDYGKGIPPEYHKSIFKLFKRLDRKQEGTGLGLAIVSKIMDTYDGRVILESEVGKGAKFSLSFPHERVVSEG